MTPYSLRSSHRLWFQLRSPPRLLASLLRPFFHLDVYHARGPRRRLVRPSHGTKSQRGFWSGGWSGLARSWAA